MRKISMETQARCGAAVKAAQRICAERGEKLTRLRIATLEAVARSDRPIGAYRLTGELQLTLDRRLDPPSVYRVLQFWLDLGLIARVETRNAYMLCGHPASVGMSVLLLCDRCDNSVAIDSPDLARLIEGSAAALGFRIDKTIVECTGTCLQCDNANAGPALLRRPERL